MGIARRVAVAALIGAALAGCKSQNPQQNAVVPLDVPPEKFEKSKDPPITAQTHVAAGQLAQSQGNFDEALEQYHKALKIKKDCLEAVYGIGLVYTLQKDYPHAIETWNQYVKLTKGSATAYSNLGFCQEVAGNFTAAEAAYKAGIAREPRNEPCHVNYGLMLARRGNKTQALVELQQVLSPAKAHYDLASVYESLGNVRDAKAEYQQAVKLDPALDDARQKLAALGD
jgi:tetratricopeptide (TPR) repeat protein